MVKKIVLGYGGVLLGVIVAAFGVSFFLIPAKIAAGGVSGLATVVYHLANFPAGITMLVLNIPLFILSWRIIGPMFGAKTLFGTITFSIFVDIFNGFAVPMTQDLLLAAIYGGVLSGIGLGIAFRSGGSTGGTDMAAQLVARFFPTSVGQALLVVDGAVIVLAGLVFGLELAMYALIAVFLTTKTIDLVQEGQIYAKACLIISDHPEAIGQSIMENLDRGVTSLDGQGMYTQAEKQVLLVIVSRMEIATVKRIVAELDPRAFVIIYDVHEVLGEGFRGLYRQS
ncbi:MAG: YitT family protein [Firmicutes bacterium]|nr:YitT family protein [Bacillota bacterium]